MATVTKPIALDETLQTTNSKLDSVVSAINGIGSAPAWSQVTNKPFSTIGDGLKVVNGALAVDTATVVEADNTKPVTSGAVHVQLGNIETLLANI